jgi:hypothetical protein
LCLLPTFQLFRWPLPAGEWGGREGGWPPSSPQENLTYSTLAEVICSNTLGKTEMGFIYIIIRMLVFWKLLKGEIARRVQVWVIKEGLHFLSNAAQSLTFICHFERRRSLTLTQLFKKMCAF